MAEVLISIDDLERELGPPRIKNLDVRKELVPVIANYTRDLQEKDLLVSEYRPAEIDVGKVRARHHTLARLMGQGIYTDVELSALTGYMPRRIRDLRYDPAFAELVEAYRVKKDAVFEDAARRLKDMMTEASAILLERLEENPDGFTSTQLLEIVKTTADRSGFGPTTTQKSVNEFQVSDETINKIKDAVNGRQNGQAKQIEQTKDIEGEFTIENAGQPEEYSSDTADLGFDSGESAQASAGAIRGEEEV